jgi:hypothetical protein
MKVVFVVPVFTSNALDYPFCKYRRRQLALDSKSGLQNWQPANLFWNGFCGANKKSVLILVLLANWASAKGSHGRYYHGAFYCGISCPQLMVCDMGGIHP